MRKESKLIFFFFLILFGVFFPSLFSLEAHTDIDYWHDFIKTKTYIVDKSNISDNLQVEVDWWSFGNLVRCGRPRGHIEHAWHFLAELDGFQYKIEGNGRNTGWLEAPRHPDENDNFPSPRFEEECANAGFHQRRYTDTITINPASVGIPEDGKTYTLSLRAIPEGVPNWSYSEDMNFTMTSPKEADLTVSSLSVSPRILTEGETFSVSFNIDNIGSATADDARYRVYDNGSLIRDDSAGNISRGGGRSVSFNRTSSGVGTHTIRVVADPDNRISEENEGNNEGSRDYTVRARPIPTGDIWADDTSISYNDSTTVRWSSTNATSCNIDRFGSVSVSGSRSTGSLTSSRTYTLTCSGDGGSSAPDSVTISVGSAPRTLSMYVRGAGGGRADSSPAGISNCRFTGNSPCNATFSNGTSVTISASPDTGSEITNWRLGWSPSNSGTPVCGSSSSCSVSMGSDQSLMAQFEPITYNLSVSKTGSGGGGVSSSPSGINCGGTCSATYNHGTTVTLSASADSGSAFTGWSGACSGGGSCSLGMTSGKSVTATFTANAPTVKLSASPNPVSYGGSSTLSWSSTNAASCAASGGWSGSKGTSGTESTGSLTSNKTYTLVCSGAGGASAPDSETVSVGAKPKGDINLRGQLDGANWNGSVSYRIYGPSTLSGNSVNSSTEHGGVDTATWTFVYISGGPPNADFAGLSEPESQTLGNGATITYTLLFSNNEPDLDIVSGPSLNPSSPTEGESVTFNSTTKNIGNSAAGNSTLSYTLDGAAYSNHPQGLLDSGESRQTVTPAWTATAGGHTLTVCADSGNVLSESNENNNCSTTNFNVSVLITQCNDGADNDGDGAADYPADAGCACENGLGGNCPDGEGGGGGGGGGWNGPPVEAPQCGDGIDNDGDGWIDYPDDKACVASWGESESGSGNTQCSDGIDNDGDGFIDGNDPNCANPDDNTESSIRFEEF